MDTSVDRIALSDAVAWVDGDDAVYVTRLDQPPVLVLQGPAMTLFHTIRAAPSDPRLLVDHVLDDMSDAPPDAADSLMAVVDVLAQAKIIAASGCDRR